VFLCRDAGLLWRWYWPIILGKTDHSDRGF